MSRVVLCAAVVCALASLLVPVAADAQERASIIGAGAGAQAELIGYALAGPASNNAQPSCGTRRRGSATITVSMPFHSAGQWSR